MSWRHRPVEARPQGGRVAGEGKFMSVKKRYVIPAIITVVLIAIIYYVTIPPINIKSVDFWWFLIEIVVIVGVCFGIPRMHDAGTSFFDDLQREGMGAFVNFKRKHDEKKADEASEAGDGKRKPRKKRGFFFYVIAIVVILMLVLIIGNAASSAFFNARAYSNLVDTKEGNFAADIDEIKMSSVPVVDRDTAIRLGSRTIGEMSDLVSQFGIDESYSGYTQINYKNAPYRVSPLTYADPIKWLTNTGKGLPGFVTVNMATQDTELVRLPEGHYIRISTGEHFNNYLYRYVRFKFPTEMFGEAGHDLTRSGNVVHMVIVGKTRIGYMVIDIELDLFRPLEGFRKGAEAVRFAAVDGDIRLRPAIRHLADALHPRQKEKLLRDGALAHDAAADTALFQHRLQPHRRAERVAVGAHMAKNRGAVQLSEPHGHLLQRLSHCSPSSLWISLIRRSILSPYSIVSSHKKCSSGTVRMRIMCASS